MFFISFLRILPLDEFFYVVKSFQILQNKNRYITMILFRITENWRFDMLLLCLKWFCYIEKITIEWQNSRKAYKKQTLMMFLFTELKFSTLEKNNRKFPLRITPMMSGQGEPIYWTEVCYLRQELYFDCWFGVVCNVFLSFNVVLCGVMVNP